MRCFSGSSVVLGPVEAWELAVYSPFHIPEAAAAWVTSPSAAETILQGVSTHPGGKEV